MKIRQKRSNDKKTLTLLLAAVMLIAGFGVFSKFKTPTTAQAAAAYGGISLASSTQTALEAMDNSKSR